MSSATAIRPLRVLLVENHPDTLESLKLYLDDSGHEVATAMTLAQARQLLSRTAYDVLICDIGLPDGTGWDLMERLPKERRPFAVAMSGFGMNADSVRSQSSGYRRHLLKPFRAASLDKVLAEAASERDRGAGPAKR